MNKITTCLHIHKTIKICKAGTIRDRIKDNIIYLACDRLVITNECMECEKIFNWAWVDDDNVKNFYKEKQYNWMKEDK
ncbi:hypothetical protein [Mesoplasma coleopterae]|uniref:Uncharacterized protein n=1 Tax=Mesoplasma coleopterae TaxID=324078 RepID=A0A2K8P284_9MOLU|nr:hypothetical protein [Mesoplasma coleopterae]ATZ20839.1 hypothetical protein MCOLE_v1c03250 [Mesoplasma coleopterae]